MSPQHDYIIDNSTGANVRSDINSALLAISSNNSGSSAPSTTYALQSFANTTDSMLQLRNAANNAFVNLRKFDGSLPLPDGSASSPSLFFDDDTNTGIFSNAADTLDITTGGTSRFLIDPSGNCGIGVTNHNPLTRLHVQGSNAGALQDVLTITNSSGSNNTEVGLIFECGADEIARISAANEGSDIGPLKFMTASSSSANPSEKMRIEANGNLGINTTDPQSILSVKVSTSRQLDVIKDSGDDNLVLKSSAPDASFNLRSIELAGASVSFSTGASSGTSYTQRMLIDSSGNIGAPSGTNIFNASDSRVKTNVVDLNKGLSDIKSLRPVSFNWIDGFCDEEKNTLYGFIAQEVQAVDTNLIQDFATELTVDNNKIENVLRVNEKFIIPMLVKAIQELSAKVEALEAT